jgi:hypothetical protein
MKLPDEALVLLVRQWIAKAEVNYHATGIASVTK